MSSYKFLIGRRALMERKKIYESWKRSGLTKAKFCRQNNIGRRTFFTWIKQLQNNNYIDDNELNTVSGTNTVDKDNLEAEPIKFLKVTHVSSQKSFGLEPGSSSSLEISLRNGAVIKATVSQNYINTFLQELLKWR
jgi:hypothetical protein